MAINLQKLIDEIQARLNTTTGSTPVSDLSRLSKISSTINDMRSSVTSYPGLSNLPVADSSNHGDIVYSLDSGAYRISEQLAWREITLNADSAIAAAATGTQAQGSTSGYASGGMAPPVDPVPTGSKTTIEKYSFTSDANAADVGDITTARNQVAGHSSTVSGYTSGSSNVIDKFPFASDGNATDVGDLTFARDAAAGQSSTDNGYSSGGSGPFASNRIDKFPFASDANSTDAADLSVARYQVAGQSSTVSGYTSGGKTHTPSPTNYNIIDKFPFASDGNATDVGDLVPATNLFPAGQNSQDNGYSSGGYGTPSYTDLINKFPFASDANATDVGDLTVARGHLNGGTSSTGSGYTSGGQAPPLSPTTQNIIDKFPFASDGNATDVGDLVERKLRAAGQQV